MSKLSVAKTGPGFESHSLYHPVCQAEKFPPIVNKCGEIPQDIAIFFPKPVQRNLCPITNDTFITAFLWWPT
jgi:hypothetical protein